MGRGAIGFGAIAPIVQTASDTGAPGDPDTWYAAHLETAFSDEDSVGTATDFGTNGYNATQGTGTAQPTFQSPCESGVVEEPCFDFDGGDELATGVQSPTSDDYLVAAVIRHDTTGTVVALDIASSSGWLWTQGGVYKANPGATITHTATHAAGEYDWHCLRAVSGGTSSFLVSGSEVTASVAVSPWNGVHLGSRNISAFHLNGAILEYLYYADPDGQGVTCSDIGDYFDETYGAGWPK